MFGFRSTRIVLFIAISIPIHTKTKIRRLKDFGLIDYNLSLRKLRLYRRKTPPYFITVMWWWRSSWSLMLDHQKQNAYLCHLQLFVGTIRTTLRGSFTQHILLSIMYYKRKNIELMPINNWTPDGILTPSVIYESLMELIIPP